MKRESPDASPAAVAELAARMARDALTPDTRLLALQAVRKHWEGPADTSGAAYVAALGRWAEGVRFVREPLVVGELVAAPWRTFAYNAGDCDDLACAAAAFAAVVGLPAMVAVYESAPGQAHAVALVGDQWNGPPGRLTHVIDHAGAKVAPADILMRSVRFPVSVGM